MWTPDQSVIVTAAQREAERKAAFVSTIKAECRRRILLVMSEDEQRNTLAAGQAATMQYGADPSEWPEELRTRQQAAMTAWTEIERLRARSNELENTTFNLPVDFDGLWN